MTFKRILCAFDGSPPARAALAFATDLAGSKGAILLCQVIDRSRVIADIGQVPGGAQIASDALAACERDLELTRNAIAEKVARAECTTLQDVSVWRALTTEAARWRADLVITGAGSRHRGIIGSTAERVVRHAPCAVLVVGGEARPPARLLCAVDMSIPARNALNVAIELAAERGAELALVHAVSDRDRALVAEAALVAGGADARRTAEATMRRWVAEIDPGVRSRTVVAAIEGRPADVVVETARDGQYDLIVVGSHGRTGIQRVLLGSVAEAVVRWADRPVLVVR